LLYHVVYSPIWNACTSFRESIADGQCGAFLFALRGVGDPRNSYPGWVLAVGIVCLIAGLTAASFVTWRGRWR
jgi:hypothetical protein